LDRLLESQRRANQKRFEHEGFTGIINKLRAASPGKMPKHRGIRYQSDRNTRIREDHSLNLAHAVHS